MCVCVCVFVCVCMIGCVDTEMTSPSHRGRFCFIFSPRRSLARPWPPHLVQLAKIAHALGVPHTARSLVALNVPPSQAFSVPVQTLPRLLTLCDNVERLVPVHSSDGWTVMDDVPPHRVLLAVHRMVRVGPTSRNAHRIHFHPPPRLSPSTLPQLSPPRHSLTYLSLTPLSLQYLSPS